MTDMTQSPPHGGDTHAPARARIRWDKISDHAVLILGSFFMLLPVLMTLLTSTHDNVTIHNEGIQFGLGGETFENYQRALFEKGGFTKTVDGAKMMMNSMILGIGFALGKIVVSMMAAYAIVYFRFRFGTIAFWMIFTTLLLPLEVRILPSYEVVQSLGMLNTYSGLIIPLIASATGTFYFRQFYKSVPEETLEAARIDGAGPVAFFIDILVPLSRTIIAAIFIIMFVYGWNQYLWPTLMTTDEGMFTLVRGIKQIMQVWIGANIPDYGVAMALAIIAMTPPVAIVILFQNWFVKGLVETEK